MVVDIYVKGSLLYEYSSHAKYNNLNIKYLNGNGFDELETLLPELSGKTLCFISNKKHGEKMVEVLKTKGIIADFVTAENKDEEATPVVKNLANNQKFKSKVLIATSVLDVGVSIHDDEVQNVIIDAIEKNTFLQMLGRIRTNDEQVLNLFICSRNSQYFENWIEQIIIPALNISERLLKVDEKLLLVEISKLKNESNTNLPIYYDQNGVHINKFSVKKWNILYLHCLEMKEGLQKDPDFFIKRQLTWLGQEENFSISNYVADDVRKIKKKNLILAILEKGENALKGKLSKEEITQFLANIKPQLRDLDMSRIKSSENVSVKRFNEICVLENIPIRIKQEQDSKDRKQKYWLEILELDDKNILV